MDATEILGNLDKNDHGSTVAGGINSQCGVGKESWAKDYIFEPTGI